MYYTQADAEQAVNEVMKKKKVLFFEGAGCAERGDVENCRIRTAFTNDNGDRFYLELSGFEVHKWTPDYLKHFQNVGHIDYCYQLGKEGEKLRADIERLNFEYSKAGILAFVNQQIGCSFDEIKITDTFYGYRVHREKGGYNFMEDFNFDEERAAAARSAYKRIDMRIREQLGERYSKISLESIDNDGIRVRCYASDQSMWKHGLDPKQRIFTEKF